jgi:hypothetical protein
LTEIFVEGPHSPIVSKLVRELVEARLGFSVSFGARPDPAHRPEISAVLIMEEIQFGQQRLTVEAFLSLLEERGSENQTAFILLASPPESPARATLVSGLAAMNLRTTYFVSPTSELPTSTRE